MDIVTTRFGVVTVPDTQIFRIPEGLVGFRSFTQYALLPDTEVAGLSWLQSTTAPELAFALVEPHVAVSDYKLDLRPGDRAALELEDEREAAVHVILNRSDAGGLTVNLQGPLVLNAQKRVGRQLVLTSSRYAVRYPLGSDASSTVPAVSMTTSGNPSAATSTSPKTMIVSKAGNAKVEIEVEVMLSGSSGSSFPMGL